ncbi:hypothetical protein BT93_L3497 [Corymbia citriodora subsp. variegata]|uniref:Flap endonuclease 1 n=1 Tax=Corymbia citriodora subsp. variegata TaxID=360336 RepID=A0A8T0CWU8_CORYI|nr:hypothetical protein BT93_L3497 [Corymbia citriodora subsp. variegata]
MKEQMLESYFGRGIAVDASMSICQFFVKKGTQMLTMRLVKSPCMFYWTIRLLEAWIKPVYVFDGKPPDLKKQGLAKRFSKRADASEELAVTQQHNEECKRLLRLMGVPAFEAPSEAEAQCAALCEAGKVYAVASEDMDSLTFGAPRFLHHLMDPSSREVPVMEFEISKVLIKMNLDMDQFIDLCILSGCDYCVSIQGGLTALELIRNVCLFLNSYQMPDNWPSSKAQWLFREPIVSIEEQPEIKWTAPNKEGLISSLSDEGMASIFSDVLVSCLLWEVASFTLKERTYMFSMLYYHVYQAIEKIKAAKDESSQGCNPFISLRKPLIALAASKCRLQSPNLAFKPKTFSTKVSVNSQPRFLCSFKMPTMVLGLRNFKKPLRVFCLPTWI